MLEAWHKDSQLAQESAEKAQYEFERHLYAVCWIVTIYRYVICFILCVLMC